MPVTIHLPLKEIFRHLSTELVVETGRIVAHDLATRFRHSAAAARGRRTQPACRRKRHARRGRPHDRRAGGRAARRRRHRRQRSAAGRLAVPQARPRDLRRSPVHVSRSGADPDQDARFRSCRQRHARASVRANVARSRHRLRHCRYRQRRSDEPDRGAPACRRLATADGPAAPLPRRDRRAGRPAAAARSHSPARSHREEIARTEFPARPQSCRPHRAARRDSSRIRRSSRLAPGRAD